MKKTLLLFLILSAALLTGGERIVFSTPGTFHTVWRYIGKIPLIPRTVFSVVPSGNNGNSKLVVEARKSSGMMMQYLNVDLEKTPVMRWRWRVVMIPMLPSSHGCAPSLGIGAIVTAATLRG